MKDTEISLFLMESSKPIFVDGLNIFEEEIFANQTALHSTQPIRNLPNILRNNNTKICKNSKTLTLNKIDTFSISEDLNTSFELNTILSSIDLEMETSYNKITSPKSHHQRKQVHNPLDFSYDMPDGNNNKDKNMLRKVNQLNSLCISNYKKNTSLKRLKYNKQKINLCNKKPRRLIGRKSNCKTRNKSYKKSYEKLDFDTELPTISQVNMKKNVSMQDVNDISSNIIFTESICEANTSNYINDLNNFGAKSVESSNIFHYNNENYKFEKKYDINYNPIISGNSTELIQNKNNFGENLTNYEFPIMKNDLEKELINKDITSNFLLNPKVLYTCTCANCMLHDKDIIFYEEPVSTSINNNMETELFTYDFYTGDYYGDILGDNWLEELDKKNLYHEKLEEAHIMEKNLCTSNDSIAKLVENNANISLIQDKSQNLQSYHIDKAQNINNNNIESCSTEIVTQPNGPINFFNPSENINIFNEMDHLNLENSLMKENKILFQDKSLIQTTISADVSLFKSKEMSQENKQGK